jgi:hypothetical protein
VIWKLLLKVAPLTILVVFSIAMTIVTYLILGLGILVSRLFPWHP